MANEATLDKYVCNMYSHWARTELLLGRATDTLFPASISSSDLYGVEAPTGKLNQTVMEFRHVWKAGGWVESIVTKMQSEGN